MCRLDLTVRSMNFQISNYDSKIKRILLDVTKRLSTHTFVYDRSRKKYKYVIDKGYYGYHKPTGTYSLPISILSSFIRILKNYNISKDQINLVIKNKVTPKPVNIKFNNKFKPYKDQKQYISAITSDKTGKFSLVDLPPGSGKTIIGANSIYTLNNRTGIIVLPKYIDKWIKDIITLTSATEEDIYVVKGTSSLSKLIASGDKYKFIIFAMRTMNIFINRYENGDYNHDIPIYDILDYLGIGTILHDESHQEFHTFYKLMSYLNTRKVIGLSGSMVNLNEEINDKYEIIYPSANRVTSIVVIKPYVDVITLLYNFKSVKGIKYTLENAYNHIEFEKSIINNPKLLIDYMDMIYFILKLEHINEAKSHHKAIVYASSIKFCTLLTKYIKDKEKELVVNRYVEKDDYNNVENGNIIVTTYQNAGTAFDIPNLITVLQTNPMSSVQANIQMIGRIRYLEDEKLTYIHMYAKDIPKHNKMRKDRDKAIAPKSKTKEVRHYHKVIGYENHRL